MKSKNITHIWSIYVSAVGFVIHTIYLFSSHEQRHVLDVPFGVALFLTSAILLTVTSISRKEETLCGVFRLLLVTVWFAKAIYHLSRSISKENKASNTLVLSHLPGYLGYLLVLPIFCMLCCIQKHLSLLLQFFCFLLTVVFETASIWKDLLPSAGACFVILASISVTLVANELWEDLRPSKQSNSIVSIPQSPTEDRIVVFVIIYQTSNVICSCVYAAHAFWPTFQPAYAYSWIASVAVIQLYTSLLLARKKSSLYAGIIGLSGVFWLDTSFFLAMKLFMQLVSLPLIAIQVCLTVVFLSVAVVCLSRNVFLSIQNLVFLIISILRCVNSNLGLSISCCGMTLVSLYGVLAFGLIYVDFRLKLPMGTSLNLSIQQISKFLRKITVSNNSKAAESLSKMGYSKYSDYSSVGFLANSLAALAVTWEPANWIILILPWTLFIGGFLQIAVGSISFSRGNTFESSSNFLIAAFWAIWGGLKSFNLLSVSFSESVGCVSFLIVGVVMLVISASISKMWFAQWLAFILVIIAQLLTILNTKSFATFAAIVSVIFALVSFYGFLSSFTTFLPIGLPFLNVSYLHSQHEMVVWADSKKSSGLESVADILKNGGIVGLPSDTVYILVAACNRPGAVKRLYETKKQATQRPMSLWISSLDQLSSGRESDFSDFMWRFMQAVWPSSMSLVIPRGNWVDSLGMEESAQYVGKPDSIAVRMPDTTILNHLIYLTGPIAVTSANPSGEADTTHHLQVLAKLGAQNCDAVLCDGPSAENIASTVIDCRELDKHKIGFFRVGLVPKSRVFEIFVAVKKTNNGDDDGCSHDSGLGAGQSDANSLNRPFESNQSDVGKPHLKYIPVSHDKFGVINEGFLSEDAVIVHTPMTEIASSSLSSSSNRDYGACGDTHTHDRPTSASHSVNSVSSRNQLNTIYNNSC